jgi:hypothetical protein
VNGYKAWYLNGKIHNLNGPALIDMEGGVVWCIEGADLDPENEAQKEDPKFVRLAEIKAVYEMMKE